MTLVLVATEFVAGSLAHSLALTSDAWHNLKRGKLLADSKTSPGDHSDSPPVCVHRFEHALDHLASALDLLVGDA